jgi:hypothetical protein
VILRRLVPAFLLPLCLALAACSPTPPAAATSATPPLETLTALPAELAEALDSFRAEGPRGWAFTQTTSGADKARVERYNPRLRGSARWTLLSENGVPPTEAELDKYRATRPSLDSAAGLAAQLERGSVAVVARDETSATYEFGLKPVSDEDKAAPFMRARFTQDRATRAFTRVELFNTQAFKPAFSLTIHEARTTLTYLPPSEGLPALPHEVVMHVRGERFFMADFEQTVTSRYTDHEYVAEPAP